MNGTPADEGLRHAARGWSVIPVMGKRPVGHEWQKRANCDPAQVASLFATSTHDGVGLLLGERSGVIDFDIDSPEAEETIEKLFDGIDIETPCFQSTRGRHYLFKWTDRFPEGSIKIVVDGLEIRLGDTTKGAQTVLPPSGGRVWIIDPDSCPLAEIPAQVIERINARYAEIHAPKPIAKRNFVVEGRGSSDDVLNVPRWLAKHNREIIGQTEGADGVTRWHIECPGFDSHTTANSWRDCCVTQDASGRLGGCCFHASCGMGDWQSLKLAIGDLTYDDYHEPLPDVAPFDPFPDNVKPVVVKDPAITSSTSKLSTMNDDFFRIPGLIGDMVAFHHQFAPRPQPHLSLLASIALMGVLTGRKIQSPSGFRTNIYCIGLAPSGAGKDQPRHDNIKILTQAGCPQFLAAENPSSDSALVGELEEHPARLMQIDEVHKYLSTTRASNTNTSSHLKALNSKFLELTGAASNPFWTPKSWAEKAKKRPIAYPHLCIFGVGTIEGFWDCVTSSDAADGFLARMMVIEAPVDHPRLRLIKSPQIPQAVIDIVKDWVKFMPPGAGDMSDLFPEAAEIPADDDAWGRLYEHSESIEDQLPKDPVEIRPIWARCSALANRLALIYAASRGPFELRIKLADADAAVRQANWCTRLMVNRIYSSVADNEDDKKKKKLLAIIKSNGPISSAILTRKSQWIKDGRIRREMLQELVDGQFVVYRQLDASPRGGQGTGVYEAT